VLGINQVCNKLRASLEVTSTVGWLPQIDGFNWDSGFTLTTTFTGRHHRAGGLRYADANDDDDDDDNDDDNDDDDYAYMQHDTLFLIRIHHEGGGTNFLRNTNSTATRRNPPKLWKV